MKISIIIPAYNEEKRIERTLREYTLFFQDKKKEKEIIDFEIVVVLNACTDQTPEIVKKYEKEIKEIRYLEFEQGGKGFAIIKGFEDALKRDNELIGFVDADMATSPYAFFDLIENIKNHHGIIASRWLKNSVIKTKQIVLRTVISRGFNFLTRIMFLFPYRDTQCGAKLFKRGVIEKILPYLNITEWAFDVNLLYLCKKYGYRIKEFPTIWEDKRDSKLNIGKVPIQMFSGILRLRLINSLFEPLLRSIKFILRWADKLLNKK